MSNKLAGTLLRAALGSRMPIVEGTLSVSALRSAVTIRRDGNGVPYVEATCDEDAFYGMGFCHGQDRAFQIELYVRVARGTLSEIIGKEMLPVDRLSRRLGLTQIARAQLALAEPIVRMQFDSFARGLNDGMRIGTERVAHEFALLRAKPSTFESADILAILQFFAFALSSNWDAELARLRVLAADGPAALSALEASGAVDVDRLAIDVDVLAAAERLLDDATALARVAGLGGASNQWAISPARTATGRPLLACDPHLSPTLPAPWYLMHIRTPKWALSGACLPSQPIVSFGHNAHVAWGLTAGHVDNTDLFLEQIGPDGRSVKQGDGYVPCEVRDEVIRVKGQPDVLERVLITRHGPLVSGGGGRMALSMRGTWMAHRRLTGYDLYRARSVDDARLAYASYPAVSENRIMADVAGNILSQMVGDAPVRRKGNGMLPMPGWDPDVGWESEPLPFDALPTARNPAAGFLASANNRPTHAHGTAFLGADWLDDHRYTRIVERLKARTDWDVLSCLGLQMDQTSIVWRSIRTAVLDAVRASGSQSSKHSSIDAARLLEEWDGVVSATSSGAAVFELFLAEMMTRTAASRAPRRWRAALGEGTNAILPHGMMGLRRIGHLARNLVEQPAGWFPAGWADEMQRALACAVERLREAAGPNVDAWAWGRVRPLVLVHPVGSKAPMDRVFNVGPLACGGDATTIPQASVPFTEPLSNPIGIANLRMVIDVGNWQASRYILAGGQSGNPLSPHYRDQVERWQRNEGIAIAWDPGTVLAATRSTLRLDPSGVKDPAP